MPGPTYSNDQRQRFLTMMLQKMQQRRFDPGMMPPDAVPPTAQGPFSQQQNIQMDPMYIEGNPAGPQPLQMPPITVYGQASNPNGLYGKANNPDPMSMVRPGEAMVPYGQSAPPGTGPSYQQGKSRVPSYEDIAARLRAAGI